MTIKNFITTLLFLCFAWLQAYGQYEGELFQPTAYTVKTVPNVQLEDGTAYTTDPEGVLSGEAKARLNAIAAGIRSDTGVELAVVVLPLITNDYVDAREFAHELFNYWGLGEKGKDNGLLVLLITEKRQREITFEVGYGLEGSLPDGLCKMIQTRVMIPLMKTGDYGGGLIAGVEEIQRVMNDSSEVKALYEQEQKESEQLGWMVFLGLLGFAGFVNVWGGKQWRASLERIRTNSSKNGYAKFVEIDKAGFKPGCLLLMVLFAPIAIFFTPMFIGWAKQSKRLRKQIEEDINCEHCGAVNTTTLVRKEKETKKNYLLTTYFFKCKNCGHEHKETEKTTYNNGGGAIGGALFSGSRSSWGGGISGGSWGGGSSGGGGSSSRF